MYKFTLLKQAYYNSKYDRPCDGYKLILKTLSPKKRNELGIDDNKIQKHIRKGEKYLYRVGKENGKFKTLSISIINFEIIRKNHKYFNIEE